MSRPLDEVNCPGEHDLDETLIENPAYLLAGIALIGVVLADIVKTTLSSNGGGVITNTIAAGVWKLFFLLSRRDGRASPLRYAGMAILVSIILTWVASLWLGLFLLFMSDPASVVTSDNKATDALEKLYFAGFSLSTLGVGDYKATTNGWRVLTTAAAFAGLVFITASVTYFVPVLSAVNLQRQLAFHIRSMGATPAEIVRKSWNGRDFSLFLDTCTTLDNMLIEHTLHHYSYPVLRYFHSNDPAFSFPRSIAVFAEAFYLIRHCTTHTGTDRLRLDVTESVLTAYLDVMDRHYVDSTTGSPPPLAAQAPEDPDLPMLSPAHMEQALARDQLQSGRKVLGAILAADGWNWKDVHGPGRRGAPAAR